MLYYFLIILIVIIIMFSIIIINSIYNNIEKFGDDNGNIIITENILNFPIRNYISPVIIDYILGEYKKNKNIPKKILNNTTQKFATLYIDPYVNYYMLNNKTNNILYDKKGYFVYISKFKMDYKDCSWNLTDKTIAYICISDYYFISSIIKGYRLDNTKIKLIRISLDDIDKTYYDVLITYVIPDSNYVKILENMNYAVTGFQDMDINRLKAFYPFLNEEYIDLKTIFTKKVLALTIYTIDKTKVLTPSMNYIVIDNIPIVDDNDNYKNYNYYNNYIENFITRIDLDKQAYDPTYFCYGDKNINNKFLCNSPYNIDNKVKNYYTFWDKVCNKDEDCPFYNKNTKKGGCNIIDNYGHCDFPVGIKRLGFTKYNDKNQYSPFCYGCDNPDELDCCNKQSEPDYVFPNDFDERSKNGKETVVSQFHYVI